MENTLPDTEAYTPAAARYLLTLRYNPLLIPVLQNISHIDMRPACSSSPKIIEDLARKAINEICKTPGARVTVSLSGGVDSTLILGLLRKYFPNLDIIAISIRFSDGHDETKLAARTAEHLGVEHTIINIDDYVRELPAAICAAALPMWDLHWYHVAKQASIESADVLISGDGGDELFGGYSFRYGGFLAEDKNRDGAGLNSIDQRIRAYLKNHIRDYVPDHENLFGPRMRFSWDDIWKVLRPHFDNALDPLEQVFLADYNGKLLYNFAHVSSAMSRHFDIKTASPLLSNEMIRYAMRIHASEKYDVTSDKGKLPLRKLLETMKLDHLVSDSKLGFSPNTMSYWKRKGYNICSTYLRDGDSRIVSDGWINEGWVRKNLSQDIEDVRYVNKFLGLLAFEIWYRIFITKDLDYSVKLS